MRLRFVLASVLVPVLVVVLAVAGGWWASGKAPDGRSSLTAALDSLPADTKVAGFTDWARIREHLGLGAASTAAARASLTNDASSRDLSTRSVIGGDVDGMHKAYGWSAADVDWEAYGQAPDGAVMVARLERSVSLGAVRAGLRKLGYTLDGGIWTISDPGSAGTTELASTLTSVAIVPRQRLVVSAGRPAYVSTVLKVVDRDQPSLLSVRSAADVAAALVGADSALLQDGSIVCESTGLQDEDADVRAQGRAAVARAGGLDTPAFSGRAIDDDSRALQTMRFAMGFGSPQGASAQLRARTALASGPFIGRDGRIQDSLVLTDTGVTGSTLSMRFDHNPDSTVYMTGEGPLLFAGCAP
jgi:hypothetical protein